MKSQNQNQICVNQSEPLWKSIMETKTHKNDKMKTQSLKPQKTGVNEKTKKEKKTKTKPLALRPKTRTVAVSGEGGDDERTERRE